MGEAPPTLRIEPIIADRWDDLLQLFGPNGAYSNCWCTCFRRTGRESSAGCTNRGAGNRSLLRSLVDDGRVPGLLAYRGDEPVGWVSVLGRPLPRSQPNIDTRICADVGSPAAPELDRLGS